MTVSPIGYAYSRDCLLSAYSSASPTFSVRQRIRELGLWTVCRLFDSRRRGIAYGRATALVERAAVVLFLRSRLLVTEPILLLVSVVPVVRSAVLSHVR